MSKLKLVLDLKERGKNRQWVYKKQIVSTSLSDVYSYEILKEWFEKITGQPMDLFELHSQNGVAIEFCITEIK